MQASNDEWTRRKQEGRGGEEEQGATREGWSGQNVVQGILSVCKKQDVDQQ